MQANQFREPGVFPWSPGRAWSFAWEAAQAGAPQLRFFLASAVPWNKKKSGRQARLFRRDRLSELHPCFFYA